MTNNNHDGGGGSASNFTELLARWKAAKAAAADARQQELSARDALVLGLTIWAELGLVAHLDGKGGYVITDEKP